MIWFFRLKESFVKKTRQRGCENGALAAKDGPHHQITLLTNAVFADFFKILCRAMQSTFSCTNIRYLKRKAAVLV
jgi:hypothetical protein